MQSELVEKIVHLPISERIEIIEQISRSVREDLRKSESKNSSPDERKEAYIQLRGIAARKDNLPPSDKEIKEDYADYLAEKYK